jgi:hypothetical protein
MKNVSIESSGGKKIILLAEENSVFTEKFLCIYLKLICIIYNTYEFRVGSICPTNNCDKYLLHITESTRVNSYLTEPLYREMNRHFVSKSKICSLNLIIPA